MPYDGEDSFSIGYKHITEPIPVPSLVTADERRLFEVIKRMLMKDPFDRFQTCEELIGSFQGQPIAAPGALRASMATVPSLVMWGDRDPYIQPRFGDQFGAREVVHYPTAGHWPMLEMTDDVVSRLEVFLG